MVVWLILTSLSRKEALWGRELILLPFMSVVPSRVSGT